MRVLQVFGEPLSNGGQESFVMNMYRNINKNKIQFDFYTPYYCDNKILKKEIEKLGGNVFAGNGSFFSKGNKSDFIKKLDIFLTKNKYDIVHIHSGSIFSLAFGARIAKKRGIKKVIVHSHATGINNIKYKIIKFLTKNIFLKNVDIYLACSNLAAKWKFPLSIIKQQKYTVIINGIDTDKFKYNKEIRKEYREKLGLTDNFVIGHVGRMEYEKNHKHILDVFSEIAKIEPTAKLVLVGEGTLSNEINNIINEKGLTNKIIILSKRNDVNCILQAMDVFIFPSLFEGLGIVAIEAQAAGLPVICSENIQKEVYITNLCKKIDLSLEPKIWAEEIIKYKNFKRINYTKEVNNAGYDAKETAKILEEIYLGEI